jgi:hypothetical protein
VLIGKILANMTQVSDVAPGPLVFCFASVQNCEIYMPTRQKSKLSKTKLSLHFVMGMKHIYISLISKRNSQQSVK